MIKASLGHANYSYHHHHYNYHFCEKMLDNLEASVCRCPPDLWNFYECIPSFTKYVLIYCFLVCYYACMYSSSLSITLLTLLPPFLARTLLKKRSLISTRLSWLKKG